METICSIGATRNARYPTKANQPPSVSVGGVARICRAPIYITVPPTIPISMVAESVISEIAVSERITLSNRRCTPDANTRASPASA